MTDKRAGDTNAEDQEQRRDEMLKRLLKTPPQPRPKRDRQSKVDGDTKSPEKGGGRRQSTNQDQ